MGKTSKHGDSGFSRVAALEPGALWLSPAVGQSRQGFCSLTPGGPSLWAQFHLWKMEASVSSMIPCPPNTAHGRGRTSPPLEGGRV